MQAVREPAVAGIFYPAGASELRRMVAGFLDRAQSASSEEGAVKGLIAPHAGYVYSGPVAAFAFRLLEADAALVQRVVLLGPAHRVAVAGLALPDAAAFATPLGEVAIDQGLASKISDLPQVEVSGVAHAMEHSLEVELPFLQQVLPQFTLLPLVVGEATEAEVAQVLDRVWGGSETRIVVSSDLSHYLPYESAARIDRETADQILRLEGPIDPRRACGAGPIGGLLAAARRRALRAELLDLRSSGDTAGGRSEVVGYGAFAFREVA